MNKLESNRKVILKTQSGDKVTLTCHGSSFARAAVRWSRSLRNRRRWLGSEVTQARRRQAIEEATKIFLELEDPAENRKIIRKLASGGIVEVTLPNFETEAQDWALRIFPWEYFLSTLTREERKSQRNALPFLITRVLPLKGRPKRNDLDGESNVLMVQSSPPPLDEIYTFDNEAELLRINLDLEEKNFRLTDPTSQELEEYISSNKPGLIHLTGFDLHQASPYLPEEITDGLDRHADGYILSSTEDNAEVINSETLANILNAASTRPVLVSFNVFNSAARLCALAVAGGAKASIGFQDEIDDRLAEVFYASFYRTWKNDPDSKILHAFQTAFEDTRRLPDEYRIHGSGIVLWSNISLLDQHKGSRRKGITAPLVQTTGTGSGSGELLIEVTPYKRLNYAILHNRGHLFKQFSVTRKGESSPDKIQIEVIARIGADEYPYRASHNIGEVGSPQDISQSIRIPLSWDYLRTLSETLRTTVYVRIMALGKAQFEQTYPVDVAPLEEWSDTDEDRIWLPSFVLPRDVAVIDAVAGARHYLSALSDDPSAGFDGYQSYGLYADDPYGPIDLQARAIWSTLLLDHRLQYINPPPSYYSEAQRIRSPSEIIKRAHGTCIDLTLLLAACFEYVEIHPVLFLIAGHALPGYWRSQQQADYFVQGAYPDGHEQSDDFTQDMDMPSWMYSSSHLERIYAFISAGHLVPVESTLLTVNRGFFAACDAGIESLSDPARFQYLIDVRRARSDPQGATPLPINNQLS